jgi:hypothetical protein
VATFVGLHGSTLVRLMPHDGVGARAIAGWLVDAGVHELLVVHDHDDGYGVPVGVMCAEAARERGLAVRSRPVWDHDESPADDIGDAQAVLYVGVAGGSDRAATRSRRALDAGPRLSPRPLLNRRARAHHLHEVWVLRRLRRRAGLGPVGRPAHVARQRPEV